MITPEIQHYIDKSVLCWLATADAEGFPNVSPKEIFASYKDQYIIIANIASPQTVKNIKQNANVCISFIDVLVQKGFQLKGTAEIIKKSHPEFPSLAKPLETITEGKFPFASITKIFIQKAKPILAPRYLLFPETTEAQQIASAKKAYLSS